MDNNRIDPRLLNNARKLRRYRIPWSEIADVLGVRSPYYLARRVRETFGDEEEDSGSPRRSLAQSRSR